jgi:hypothetical protein
VGISAAVGAALVPATTAFAATPALTVTVNADAPNLNAQSGGTVTAVGSGFTPGATVALVECSSIAPDGSGCDQTPANAKIVTADANGGFTANDVVVTTGPKGTAGGSCGAGSTCFVAGANLANQAEAAADDFLFDNLQVTPRTNLKNGAALSIEGANYTPGATVYVSECTSTVPAEALQKCDINSVSTYTADANGHFTGTYDKVHTNPAAETGPYPCMPGKSCVVAGSDSIANPGAGHIGGALVHFAALTKTATKATASKAHVAKNAKFSIKGKVTAAGNAVKGLKVTLYKVKKSGLAKVGKAKTTSSTGSVKFKGLTQKKTTKYELKTKANASFAGSVSKVVKVKTP